MNARLTEAFPRLMTRAGALIATIRSCSTPRTMLILLGVLLAFAPAFVALNVQLGGVTPPESMLGYSAEQAYRALDAEGDGGRRFHLLFEGIDLFLIPVYVMLYATVIAYTGERLFGRQGRVVTWGITIPLLAGFIDYVEDAALVILLGTYPEHLIGLATIAGILTLAKWIFVYTGALLALSGLLGLAGQKMLRLCQRRHQGTNEIRRLDLPRPPLAA
jgi:hypothetical protein